MSLAIAERPLSRRRATEHRMNWELPGSPANDHSALRGPFDELDDRIGVKYDNIAALMHERNAQPDDEYVAARLQSAFDELRVLQHERAGRMSSYFRSKSSIESDEVSDTIKRARDIVKQYENTSFDNASITGSVLEKP